MGFSTCASNAFDLPSDSSYLFCHDASDDSRAASLAARARLSVVRFCSVWVSSTTLFSSLYETSLK